MLPISWGIT